MFLNENFTTFFQFDNIFNTLTRITFTLVGDIYEKPKFDRIQLEKATFIGRKKFLIKVLDAVSTRHVVERLSDDDKELIVNKSVAAIATVNNDTSAVNVMVCTVKGPFKCYCAFSTQASSTDPDAGYLTAFNASLMIVSKQTISMISLDPKVASEKLTYDPSLKANFTQKVHGCWYAASDRSKLVLLEQKGSVLQLKTSISGPSERLYFYGLESTQNFVIGLVKRLDYNDSLELLVYGNDNPNFFSNESDAQSPWNADNLTHHFFPIKRSDFPDPDNTPMMKFYEHQGKLFYIINNQIFLATVPPVEHHPEGKKIVAQNQARFNKSYDLQNETIRTGLLFPSTDYRFALITMKPPSKDDPSWLPSFNNVYTVRPMEWGQVSIEFFDFSAEDLLRMQQFDIDVVYNDYPHYFQERYSIRFDHFKSSNNYFLIATVALGFLIVLIGLVIMFRKFKAAMREGRKASLHYSDAGPSLDEPLKSS